MGFGGISPGSLLLVFLIVVLLFGTKKLRGLGEDLGAAVKSFKKGLNAKDDAANDAATEVAKITADKPQPRDK